MHINDVFEQNKMLDVESPQVGVEIAVRDDGKVVWVNADGRCLFRMCCINVPVEVNDARSPTQVAQLKSALERARDRLQSAVAGKPIRDLAETYGEIAHALQEPLS